MDDKLFMVWFVVSFVFRNQTRPDRTTPFLGSWIGSHPHRFVRIDRCVVDRDAEERERPFDPTSAGEGVMTSA